MLAALTTRHTQPAYWLSSTGSPLSRVADSEKSDEMPLRSSGGSSYLTPPAWSAWSQSSSSFELPAQKLAVPSACCSLKQ